MQLIRGSLLHKFLTEGCWKLDDSALQGSSRCTFVGRVLAKFSLLTICSFAVFSFFFGNFFNFFVMTGWAMLSVFLIITSLVAMVMDILLFTAAVLTVFILVDNTWGYKIRKFWDRVFETIEKPFKKIDCGVVQVLDKRTEK